MAEALDTLEACAATLSGSGTTTSPVLVAIDDCDDLIDNPIGLPSEEAQIHKRFSEAMDTIVRAGRGTGVTVLLLSPATLDVTVTDRVFGVTFPRRTGFRPTPGSAVLLRRGFGPEVIQLVLPET